MEKLQLACLSLPYLQYLSLLFQSFSKYSQYPLVQYSIMIPYSVTSIFLCKSMIFSLRCSFFIMIFLFLLKKLQLNRCYYHIQGEYFQLWISSCTRLMDFQKYEKDEQFREKGSIRIGTNKFAV